MTKKVRSVHSLAIQRQPMSKPVATPREDLHRDGPVAGLLRPSFRSRYGSVVIRFVRVHVAVTVALVVVLATAQTTLAAGNLTLPFADPNPRITSWMDHHYPDRQSDGVMVRFDGATGYAYDGHRGIDYAMPSNTPVVAADEGTVIYSEWSDSGGWGVVIDHASDRTAYFHNNQLFVYPGQHVSRGQLIALSGSTGNSTGPHVHFEVRDLLTPWHSIDPYGWTGRGPDPWSWDIGNLWTGNRPVPFVLPLAFPGGARWNYWYGAVGPPSAGKNVGAVRFFGDPGTAYQFRLTVRDAARNAAPAAVLDASVPASSGPPPTLADGAILGALPAQPDGAPPVLGVKQEHPSAHGALLLGSDASLHGLGADHGTPSVVPTSTAPAVDMVSLPSGPLRLLADGTTWNGDGAAGPSFALTAPMRLLTAGDGTVIAFGSAGAIAESLVPSGTVQGRGHVGLPAGTSVIDAALFPGTPSGLALDSSGAVHAFGGADAALTTVPSSWTLPGQPAAITLAGTAQAPCGILTDAAGDWQVFGSLLLLPDASFAGPSFDPMTGLPVR